MLNAISTPDSPSCTSMNKLSPRELDVLRLVVEGCTNAEIATSLHLSISTVKTHIRGILNKLGASHRIQAAVIALRHQLV